MALIGKIPLAVASGLTAGGEIGAAWWTQNMTGLFRHACDPIGSYSYMPLYSLKRIRKPGLLDRAPVPEGDDL